MHDVIVIGGGPSGSTMASLLAKAGLRVLVIERETFPRFHIGESLLPGDLAVLDALDVKLPTRGIMHKSGADFVDDRIGKQKTYLFQKALPGTPGHAYQVERACFDEALLRRAEAWGATVHEGERVTQVDTDDGGVSVRTTRDTYKASYVVDASGLDAFLAHSHKSHRPLTDFGLAATFRHLEGIDANAYQEFERTGNIKVMCLQDGWGWMIPLGNQTLSVGMVTRKKGIDPTWLDQTIDENPTMKRLTTGGKLVRKPGLLASFSFKNDRAYGARFVCVGDAGCFLDPVFSSGVSIGMVSAMRASEILIQAFKDNTVHDERLMAPLEHGMQRGYETFASMINAWYHSDLLHHMFFHPEPDQELELGVTSVLALDCWREDNRFQNLLLDSRRRYRGLEKV